MNYPPPPLVLQPGEKTIISVEIPMTRMLSSDFMTSISKAVRVRAGLSQTYGYKLEEITHGSLYKLELPEVGKAEMGLKPLDNRLIKPPNLWTQIWSI
jgi:hypothetical protein